MKDIKAKGMAAGLGWKGWKLSGVEAVGSGACRSPEEYSLA